MPSRLPAVLRTLDLYQLEVLANKWAIEQSQQSRGSSFNGVKVAVIVAGVVAGNSERRLGAASVPCTRLLRCMHRMGGGCRSGWQRNVSAHKTDGQAGRGAC